MEAVEFYNAVALAYDSYTKGEGYSYKPGIGTPKDGYMVGGLVPEVSIRSNRPITDTLFKSIWSHFLHLRWVEESEEGVDAYVGTWVDDNGALVFDISERMESEEMAVASCISRGERAYYDVAREKTVYVL